MLKPELYEKRAKVLMFSRALLKFSRAAILYIIIFICIYSIYIIKENGSDRQGVSHSDEL